MQYFTYDLWNHIDSAEADKQWKENTDAYYKRVELFRDRISQNTYQFVIKRGFHDYRLKNIEIVHEKYGSKNPVKVIMLLTKNFETWQITYKGVNKIQVNYKPAFIEKGFDDWGYDELLDVDEKTLSHEVLFASGSTILIHFLNKNIFVTKIKQQ